MKIGIIGIGGIGSNVARHLAQAKMPDLKIVDFDAVEVSNLNRQFYRVDQAGQKKTDCLKENLLAIHPDMKIDALDHKIGSGEASQIFKDCTIVVEGVDQKHLKKMLIEELSIAGKLLVSASGIAGYDLSGVGVKNIGNCCIVGDFVSDQADHQLFPPKIALVAARMTAIVLEYAKENRNENI